MQANSPGAELLRTMSTFTKMKKNSSWLVYVLHKMEIRHFHVVVVWWRQKKKKCTNKCDARPELLLLFWRTRCRRRWSDLKVPVSTTTATTDTRYPVPVSLPVPVPMPLLATRYLLPATRYSLLLTLYPSTTVTCADFESNQRLFLIGRQMLLLGAHMIDYHVKDPLLKADLLLQNYLLNYSMHTSLKGCWDWK